MKIEKRRMCRKVDFEGVFFGLNRLLDAVTFIVSVDIQRITKKARQDETVWFVSLKVKIVASRTSFDRYHRYQKAQHAYCENIVPVIPISIYPETRDNNGKKKKRVANLFIVTQLDVQN